jgi:hypothetical protein
MCFVGSEIFVNQTRSKDENQEKQIIEDDGKPQKHEKLINIEKKKLARTHLKKI